jgi:pyruvate-formate lyase
MSGFEMKAKEDYCEKEKLEIFDELYEKVEGYVECANRQAVEEDYHIHRDHEHFLYENLVTAYAGQDFWDWANNTVWK